MADMGTDAERRRLADALRANLKRRKTATRPAPAGRRRDERAEEPAASPPGGERG